MARSTVDPLHGFGRIIVFADVAHELPPQVSDRCKYASGDDIALDFGEPKLDLIEPGRVSGRVVQMHAGMRSQELLHPFGFVGREAGATAMDLFSPRLRRGDIAGEGDELVAGGRGGRVSRHSAGLS